MSLNLRFPERDRTTPIGEAVTDLGTDCRIRNLSPQTVEWYSDHLQKTLPHLYRAPISSPTLTDVRTSTAGLFGSRAPATLNTYVRAVKRFLNWAVDEGFGVQVNPRRIRSLQEPKEVPPSLTLEQMDALLLQPDRRTFVGLRNHTLTLVLLDTGARVSEALGLRAADVSIPLVKVRGQGDKERLLALSQPMQKAMRRYLRSREAVLSKAERDSLYLFANRTGGRMSKRVVNQSLKRYAERAGTDSVRVSPHTCRFTFATHFLRNGGSIVKPQQCMGHSTLAMSRYYASVLAPDALEESVQFSPIARPIARLAVRSKTG